MKEVFFIGLDIGTGSTKALALNEKGRVMASAQMAYPSTQPEPGWQEQDPEQVFRAFLAVLQQVSAALPVPPAVVSISSAMHSLMAVDAQANPLTPLMLWSDNRGEEVAEALRNSPLGLQLYHITGTPIHAMSPLCKIRWIADHRPDVFSGTGKFVSIKEYIWYRLFGSFVIDESLASATGLLDTKKLDWSTEALSFAGIGKNQLGELVPTDFTKRLDENRAKEMNLPASTAFCIGGSDGCLASLGSGALDKGSAAITIGTSGAVRMAVSKPLADERSMLFNYVLDRQTIIAGGSVNNGGNTVKWLLKTFYSESPSAEAYRQLFAAAEQVPAGSEGLLFLPYLNGERAPLWDEKACGSFIGIRSFHTRDHFIRAGLEGICFALTQVLRRVEALTNPVATIHLSGGILHSAIWMQMLADITGKTLHADQRGDASAMGAAMLGLKAAGYCDRYPTFEKQIAIYQPDKKNSDRYNRCMKLFEELYPLLETTMHELRMDTQARRLLW
ncbi:MAG TPA: gluconokinase [Flavisolibacter sp.]|nr:gluconokinase [Flavisolibacter sp.]